MSNFKCLVLNCKITTYNKPPDVTLHSCPSIREMRIKWHNQLKGRCTSIDWIQSKICSKHFENKYFDSLHNLKHNAVPTLFLMKSNVIEPAVKNKVDKLLIKLTQAELAADIKTSLRSIEAKPDIENYVNNNLQCQPDAPAEAKMWLVIKKQQYLNTKLMKSVSENRNHVERVQNSMAELKSKKKEMEHSVETLQYIVKCLQEKNATLEEQVVILTGVESR